MPTKPRFPGYRTTRWFLWNARDSFDKKVFMSYQSLPWIRPSNKAMPGRGDPLQTKVMSVGMIWVLQDRKQGGRKR
jgi:hypothetical protein